MNSTHIKIINEIKRKRKGKIFFTKDFSHLGTDYVVRHTRFREVKIEDSFFESFLNK
jgi:hypothetical protein